MLNIIHLSDFHIKENKPIPSDIAKAIRRAVKCEIEENDPIIILCSGDIAFSGKANEYLLAETFFSELLIEDMKSAYLIFSPGNHDNDFSDDTSIRSSIIKDITTNVATESQIKACLTTQNYYRSFVSKLENPKPSVENLLNITYEIKYGERMITIHSMNSSFACEKECLEGKTFIPTEYLNADSIYSDYKIGLLHHTPNWFHSAKQRELRTALLNNYDMIFFGHEHETSSYSMGLTSWQSANLIEGGIIHSDISRNSTFNFVQIDFTSETIKIIEFTYDTNSQIFRNTKEKNSNLSESIYTKQYGGLSNDFIAFLDDPGATFKHPRKNTLTLSDIYIFPNLKKESPSESKVSNIISSRNIIQEDLGHIIISGDDKSGKTSFAKVIFSELISIGMTPVYFDCKDVSKGKISKVDDFILEKYQFQYINTDKDQFKQNRKEKAVPIIDNFHQAKLNNLEKLKTLHTLISHYNNLIVLTGEPFLVEELAKIEKQNNNFPNKIITKMTSYRLKTLGHALRGELLKKWFEISDEQIDYESADLQLYDEYMEMFSKIVDYNYVPPYPLYLLTAISAASSNLSNDLTTGSFGHYYQALITLALASVDGRHAEVDLKISFLSELSFYLYNNNTSNLSETKFNLFTQDYNDRFATSIQNSFIEALIDANIICRENDNIYFKYRYIYYYFVALYISKNLHEDEAAENAIDHLIKSIHKESSSSILLILINFSKDKMIINRLQQYAQSIFSDSPIANISDDTEHFNALASEAQKIIIPEATPSSSRKSQEEFKDRVTENENRDYSGNNITLTEEDEKIDQFTSEIAATIRCVDIIGQALKSHYGSLRADQKDPLFAEGLNISLRALGDFYSFMKENSSMWLEDIQNEINKRGKLSPSQIKNISNKVLMHLSSAISFYFISLPAHAFANINLSKTFKSYFDNFEKTNANKLLDFYLELESTKKINFEKLEDLVNTLKSNLIGFTVLQQIMANFLYMNKTDFKTKDKISSLLNISIKNQLIIDIKAEGKKIR